MANLLRQLTDNVLVGGLSVFALALGFFAISYLNRRRQVRDQERMAALIKGLHYAGVARDVLAAPNANSRDHLLRGLRWLLGAGALSGTAYGYASLQSVPDALTALRGLLVGLIPAAIGLAHLIFSWILSRLQRRAAVPQAPSVRYRAAAYRGLARRY